MTEKEIQEAIKDIPLGSKVQILKRTGEIIEVNLQSHEVVGTEKKDYGDLEVPALPPAVTVSGRMRFGNFRIDAEEIVLIKKID